MTPTHEAKLTADDAQRLARVAGVAYLAIFVLAIAANFFVLEPLGVRDDASATAANIAAAEPAYRAGVAAFVAVLIADIIIAWALFIVLRPADPRLSLLVLLFRLAYTAAHIAVVLELLGALRFATEAAFADGLGAGAPALAYFFFKSHGLGFTVTLIFFGVHLIVLGRLIARSGYMPRVIGWLVSLAGLAYVGDGFAAILLGPSGGGALIAQMAVIVPALVGEGSLMIWLIVRGVDRARFPA